MKAPMLERLGVCSWSLRPEGPVDLVDRVRATGLGSVQLALGPVVGDPGAWGSVWEGLEAAGIRVVSGMFGCRGEDYATLETIRRTGGLVPDGHWEANRSHARAVAEVAAVHGVPLVSFHAGFIPEEPGEARERLAGRLREVADVFGGHGIGLLLETGQETAAALAEFLDEVGRPGVGVNFDPANMILYDKGEPVAALRRLRSRVRQVHIKDAVRTTVPGQWGRETPVGEGEVDWAAFLGALEEGGFAGPLVIEREGGAERVGNVRQAIACVRAHAPAGGRAAR